MRVMETAAEPTICQHSTDRQKRGKAYPVALWVKAKKDFVQGGGTLDQIAAKHGINLAAMRDKSFYEKWGKLRQQWIDQQTLAMIPPAQAQMPVAQQTVDPASVKPLDNKLETIERQLERVDELISNAETAKEIDELTKSKERLFRQWQVLAGVPNPGSRRPAKVKSGRGNLDPVSPVEPQNPPLPA